MGDTDVVPGVEVTSIGLGCVLVIALIIFLIVRR